jgi:glucoside 3-dehydrogenase (cytochrome c) catalytic subunit
MNQEGKEVYDVLVADPGASGGWACRRFAEADLNVALVGSGRQQSDKNFTEHEPKFKLKYRDMAPEVIRRARSRQ